DGAIHSDGCFSWVGWVFRDYQDIILAIGNRRLVPQNDPPTIEALSIFYGMLCGKRLGYHILILESDAGVIFDAINNSSSCNATYGNIINDIGELKLGFEACFVRYISEEDNNLTYTIAFLAKNL
ncbi:RVT_3 domain-containing protein, partial [Cephalotus follicularis]